MEKIYEGYSLSSISTTAPPPGTTILSGGRKFTSEDYATFKLGVGAHNLLDALKDLLFLSRPLFSDPLQQRIIAKCDAAIRAVE